MIRSTVHAIKGAYYASILAGRYLSGRPLRRRRTNATYLNRATVWYGKVQPGKWELLPGWQRQVVRVVGPLLTPCLLCGAVDSPRTYAAMAVAGTGGALLYRHQGWLRSLDDRRHRRRYVVPVVKALEGILKMRVTRLDDFVHVPKDYASNPSAYVGVALPEGNPLTDATRKRVEHAVRGKLGLTNWTADWRTVGDAPRVIFRRPLPLPTFCDMRLAVDVMRGLPEGTVLLGMEAAGRHHALNLASDCPHVAAAGETGCGKSVLACVVGVQVLMSGGRVVILDIKGSHRWARALVDGKGVTYCRKIESIHDMLVSLGAERERRCDTAWTDDTLRFPRVLIIFEELGSTLEMLAAHWQGIKEKDDPKLSPAIAAYRALLAMGRSECMNMMLAAQALTAAAAGGSERRENIGGRYAAQASPQQLAYLFGKVHMPAMSRHPGRWYTVRAGVAVELQLLFPGEDKDPGTQRWIADVVGTTGCRTPGPDQAKPGTTTTDVSHPTTPCRTPGGPLAALPAAASGPPIGLRDAVDTGLIPGTLPAARRKLQRAGSRGPEVVGIDANGEKLYDPTDLRRYFKGACS